MSKVIEFNFTRGNDIVLKLSCGHTVFDDSCGSSEPTPKESDFINAEVDCQICNEEHDLADR